jgi:hypothetical protein
MAPFYAYLQKMDSARGRRSLGTESQHGNVLVLLYAPVESLLAREKELSRQND